LISQLFSFIELSQDGVVDIVALKGDKLL